MITLIAVGSIKEKANQQLIDEYLKRLVGFYKPVIKEVAEAKANKLLNDANLKMIIDEESERILQLINDKDYVIYLDIAGQALSSEAFSDHLNKVLDYQNSNITFVIGGSHGVNEKVKKRANARFSLSSFTFPHQLVRLLLIEQLYRWYTIKHHLNYHK